MEEIKRFLAVDEYLYVYGSGDGSVYGSGSGYGYGSGDGSVSGDGSGYGDGSGSGSGYGYGSGSGYGDGSGYGSGSGSGYGSGYGSGDGSGSGSGDGSGSGYGYGYGVIEYNHKKVYKIDGIATIIDSVHGNYAKGKILKNDLTLIECYIAKCGNFFAHGETLKQALADASEKYNENKPLEERIADFNETYPDNDAPIDGNELFSWHHILTGSCLFGRKEFCSSKGLDLNAKYTVREFISLTENAFGSDVIKQLKQSRNL